MARCSAPPMRSAFRPGAVSQQIIKAERQLGVDRVRPHAARPASRRRSARRCWLGSPPASASSMPAWRWPAARPDAALTVSVAPVFASKWLVPRLEPLPAPAPRHQGSPGGDDRADRPGPLRHRSRDPRRQRQLAEGQGRVPAGPGGLSGLRAGAGGAAVDAGRHRQAAGHPGQLFEPRMGSVAEALRAFAGHAEGRRQLHRRRSLPRRGDRRPRRDAGLAAFGPRRAEGRLACGALPRTHVRPAKAISSSPRQRGASRTRSAAFATG